MYCMCACNSQEMDVERRVLSPSYLVFHICKWKHTLPYMHHPHRLSVKTRGPFTFPPDGNWEKKEQAFFDRSDTTSTDIASQTTTCPARERRNCCTFSQKTWETSSAIWQRHSFHFSKPWTEETNGIVFQSVRVTAWEKGGEKKHDLRAS